MCTCPAAIYQKMDTSVGLSTIASLSLGLSMSMTGSGRAVICRNLGSAFPMPPMPPRSPAAAACQRGSAVDEPPKFPCLPQLPRSAAGAGGALQARVPEYVFLHVGMNLEVSMDVRAQAVCFIGCFSSSNCYSNHKYLMHFICIYFFSDLKNACSAFSELSERTLSKVTM